MNNKVLQIKVKYKPKPQKDINEKVRVKCKRCNIMKLTDPPSQQRKIHN